MIFKKYVKLNHNYGGIKMKSKILFLMMVIAIFSFATPNVLGAVSDSARLSIVMQSYEPFPAEPGSYVTLKMRATNSGSRTASNVAFELDPSYPFTLDPNENARRNFGSLLPGQSVVFEYKVRVDANAVIGSNKLRLRFTADGSSWAVEELDILVRSTESVLSVSSVSTNPEIMRPGEVSMVNIDLANLGATALRDISVRLGLDLPAEAAMMLPFSPVESTSEKRVRSLDGGSTERLSFNIMTFPNADSRIYRVPITISYLDESGNQITRSDVIGVVVGSEPRVSASVSNVNLNPARTELSFRFVNRGTIDLKFFNVKLRESSDFNILSTSNEYYIGRLSSDDFDIANFVISFSPDTESIRIPLLVEYLDANNREYSEEIYLDLDLASIRQLNSPNGGGGGSTIFILIIVAVVGFFVYKKFKKKKKH